MIAAQRLWVRNFARWLSLAVVLTCAVGSFGSAVQASTGSAFNAFTSDVSLGPSRASEPERVRKDRALPTGAAGQAKARPVVAALPTPRRPAPVEPRAAAPSTLPAIIMAGAVGARAPPRR